MEGPYTGQMRKLAQRNDVSKGKPRSSRAGLDLGSARSWPRALGARPCGFGGLTSLQAAESIEPSFPFLSDSFRMEIVSGFIVTTLSES